MGRTCGQPVEIKKMPNPKDITALSFSCCSRSDLVEMWPNGVGLDVNGAVTLAWTADTAEGDAFAGLGAKQMYSSNERYTRDAEAGKEANANNGTLCPDCGIAYGDRGDSSDTSGASGGGGAASASAYLFNGVPGGIAPKFFASRQGE